MLTFTPLKIHLFIYFPFKFSQNSLSPSGVPDPSLKTPASVTPHSCSDWSACDLAYKKSACFSSRAPAAFMPPIPTLTGHDMHLFYVVFYGLCKPIRGGRHSGVISDHSMAQACPIKYWAWVCVRVQTWRAEERFICWRKCLYYHLWWKSHFQAVLVRTEMASHVLMTNDLTLWLGNDINVHPWAPLLNVCDAYGEK